MWNLSGDDIARAKAEITGRRVAIQAKYESEIKKLEDDLAHLENFERAAVNFVSNFKAEDAAAAGVGSEAGADAASESAEKGSSRWRMRLGRDASAPSGNEA